MNSRTPDVFDAIADPTRRRILERLADGDESVASLTGEFQISRPAVSKHLKVLQLSGLVNFNTRGRENIYRLIPAGLREVRDWLAYYDKFWDNKLHSLRDIVEGDEEDESKK